MKRIFLFITNLFLICDLLTGTSFAGSIRDGHSSRKQILQKRISSDQTILQPILDAMKTKNPNHRMNTKSRVRNTNDNDLYEIIYETWEDNAWVPTDRYLISENQLPMPSELKDDESILLFLIVGAMTFGDGGDLNEIVRMYTPLLMMYEEFIELVMSFDYVLHQEREDESWVDLERLLSQKDAQGYITEVRLQSVEEGVWETMISVTFAYEQGSMSSATMQAVLVEPNVLNKIMKLDLSYASGDALQQVLFYAWKQATGDWVPYAQLMYSYSSQLLSNILMQYSITEGLDWFDVCRITYSYDTSQRLNLEIAQSADFSEIAVYMNNPTVAPELYNASKDSFAYDARNKLIDHKYYRWEGDLWVYDTWKHYEYDQDDHEIVKVSYDGSDHTWNEDERLLTTYADGLLTRELYQEWMGEWTDAEQTNYYYDDTQLAYTIQQEKGGDDWVNVLKKIYNFDTGTGIQEKTAVVPEQYQIHNYPNPFNASTMIVYQLPETSLVTIQIFNVQGQLVQTLVEDQLSQAGIYRTIWKGTDQIGNTVPSGTYLVRLHAGHATQIGRCLLIK